MNGLELSLKQMYKEIRRTQNLIDYHSSKLYVLEKELNTRKSISNITKKGGR
jgi:hypothetical protein